MLDGDEVVDVARSECAHTLRLFTGRAGVAEAINEREIGVASPTAPIHYIHGGAVATISVGAPVTRLGTAPRQA